MIKNALLKIKQKYKAVIILKAVLWGTIIATLFAFIPGSQDTEAWSSFDPVFATVATILRGKVGVALVVSASGCWIADQIKTFLSVL
ncbi:hypothetical protein [Marinobacter sp. tcs-11]|uniref:hypothetical protein n=1 Tax=Marinobacter sp. tcs-11 TaxID=1742860 RepID=UPI00257CB769|nr:hypothetical protein [Marinobacter sp. tcs-11]